MKKYITLLLGVFIMSIGIYSCSDASASKPEPKSLNKDVILPEDHIKVLKEAGFTNVPSVATAEANSLRRQWRTRYNLGFMSNGEVQDIMEKNDFIIGPANRFKEDIPENMLRLISMNYKKVTDKYWKGNVTYIAPDNKVWSQEQFDAMELDDKLYVRRGHMNTTVFVVAPASKFNTSGMEITNRQLKASSPDPIALMAVEGGYVILAHWE